MTTLREMAIDLGIYLDEHGYATVLEVLLQACHDRAARRTPPPEASPAAHWARREETLRHVLQEDR
jgi:hypothetical protein